VLGNFPLEVHRAKQLQCHRNLCLTWLIESSVKQGRIAKTDIFDKQIGVNMKERAFPWCGDLNDCPTINLGMTLRDYFAAKAMQTFLQTNSGVIGCNRYEYQIAEDAYDIADAMLKVRGE
jgi:hypothetical protein